MANAYGNVLEPPGTSQVAEVKPGDIIAAMGQGINKHGITILKDQGVLVAGTVMGRVTASKKWVAYDDDGTDDGRRVARGVLAESVDTTGVDKLGNLITGGTLKLSKLTGMDAAAVTDLGGREDTVLDHFYFGA